MRYKPSNVLFIFEFLILFFPLKIFNSNRDNKINNNTKFYNPKELTRGHYAANKESPNSIWGLAVFPDGDNFCTVGDDGTLRIWSSKERKQIKILKTNLDLQGKELPGNQKTKDLNDGSQGRSIDISPDGKFIAVGFKEGSVKVFLFNKLFFKGFYFLIK